MVCLYGAVSCTPPLPTAFYVFFFFLLINRGHISCAAFHDESPGSMVFLTFQRIHASLSYGSQLFHTLCGCLRAGLMQ